MIIIYFCQIDDKHNRFGDSNKSIIKNVILIKNIIKGHEFNFLKDKEYQRKWKLIYYSIFFKYY